MPKGSKAPRHGHRPFKVLHADCPDSPCAREDPEKRWSNCRQEYGDDLAARYAQTSSPIYPGHRNDLVRQAGFGLLGSPGYPGNRQRKGRPKRFYLPQSGESPLADGK